MTMPRRSGAARLRALGAAALLLGAAACGTGGASSSGGGGGGSGSARQLKGGPGVDTTAKTITLGILSPLSGAVKVIGVPLTEGQKAYFNRVNDSGGVDGYKILTKDEDTLYDPQKQVQLYNQILPDVAFIAQSLGSPTTKAIQAQADAQNVLIGAATQSSSWVTDKVMAVIGTPYAVDVANGIDYIVKQQGKKDARIGIIYQNDEYGQDGLRGYQAALDKYHFNDVGRETYTAGDKDYTAQVLHLKQKGADHVFVIATPTSAGTIVGTGAAVGFQPTWVFQGPAWSEYLMTKDGTAAGAHTPVFGALSANTLVLGYEAAWGDSSVPGMKQFLADHDKYFPQQPPDVYYIYGYCEAQMEVAVIKKAIENGDLSRKGILDAKLHLGKVDFGGLIPPVNYTPDLGPASRVSNISKVDPSAPGFLSIAKPYFEGDAAKALNFTSS